jgi:hypothetical protein
LLTDQRRQSMSKQYWVIGGEYADTRFEQIVNLPMRG